MNAQGTCVDRPTITYAPLTGRQFTKGRVTPVPPSSIPFLMQAGHPAGAAPGIPAVPLTPPDAPP